MSNIAIITGSRADRGALEEVEIALAKDHKVIWCTLPEAVTDQRVSAGRLMSGIVLQVSNLLAQQAVDLVVLHGDRYECLAAATAAYMMGKPIAHIGGGDVTEGSQDDGMRHAITKLAHLHFTSCEASTQRVLQLGEEPWRVHTVGCPGVDSLLRLELPSRSAALSAVGLPDDKFVLVTFHPNTLGNPRAETKELVKALRFIRNTGVRIVLTTSNRDPGHATITQLFGEFARSDTGIVYCNPPRDVFLALLKHCYAFVGNSSAGFYEAPTFGTPVVNVGDRQKGRQAAKCVHNSPPQAHQIMTTVFWDCANADRKPCNPHGDGQAAPRIAKILAQLDYSKLLRKGFCTCRATRCGITYTAAELGADTPTSTWSGGPPVSTSIIYAAATLGS